jgi:HD-GYP domain-containing protein (c-di-GMP phosphodiesterase class II)
LVTPRAQAPAGDSHSILISEILSGLSHALDITEGHPRGHAARACLIGMRLAHAVDLTPKQQADLFYALLLKDAGCSSNAARVHQLFGGNEIDTKRAVWLRDWRRVDEQARYALQYVGRGESIYRKLLLLGRLAMGGRRVNQEVFQIRCDRGAAIATGLGLSDDTASAIRSMDEHWDGGGHPAGLAREQIPILGRIVGLAQVMEIFVHENSVAAALDVARRRSGRWFDPALVEAFRSVAADTRFWADLRTRDERALVSAAEPVQSAIVADEDRLDRIAEAFAWVIDAKSPYTADHSRRVAYFAVEIARRLALGPDELTRVRRAALLHDIGKLGVSNSILDKPARLTAEEWAIVRLHPKHTFEILSRVPVFREFAFDSSAHHEKLDGTGYYRGLSGADMSLTARVLAVADIADALLADRPYRKGMPTEEVDAILKKDCAGGGLCGDSVSAMADVLLTVVETRGELADFVTRNRIKS